MSHDVTCCYTITIKSAKLRRYRAFS